MQWQQLETWQVLIAVRWIWTFILQTGYIHPDEYFQIAEVVSGDIFDISVYKSWEFQPHQPLRSMFLPCLLFRPIYSILDLVSVVIRLVGGPQILCPYTMVLAPRIVMLLLSSWTDMLVYRQAKLYKELDVDLIMFLHTSSYITLVYSTRTLTNAIEGFLFVSLFYVMQKDIMRLERLFKKYPRSKFTRTTRHEHPAAFGPVEWYNAVNVIILSTIIVVGFFNRPTFLLFAFVPFVHWLLDGNYPQTWEDCKMVVAFMYAGFKLVMRYAIPSLSLVIVWDSLYYSNPTNWEVHSYSYSSLMPEVSNKVFTPISGISKLFTITPLNFISYNLQKDNLAQHGLHPFYTHLTVNQLLLFGPLVVITYIKLYTVMFKGQKSEEHYKMCKDIRPYFWGYLFSICSLSLFPHQEARFLIPLLFTLIMMYAFLTAGQVSHQSFKKWWMVFNIIGCIFYGSLHQGSVLDSISFVRNKAYELPSDATMHVIYSHTYMPPKHLFMITRPDEEEVYLRKRSLWRASDEMRERKPQEGYFSGLFSIDRSSAYIPYFKLKVHDLKGQPLKAVNNVISMINQSPHFIDSDVYVIAPATMDQEICSQREEFQYYYAGRLPWHLSMEEPPHLSQLTPHYTESLCTCISSDCPQILSFSFYLSLNIYYVKSVQETCSQGGVCIQKEKPLEL